MISNTYRHAVVFVAACLIAGAAAASTASAAGTWRFKGYTIDPAQEKLNSLHAIFPADEYRVGGAFQAKFSGSGTIDSWHKRTDSDNKTWLGQGHCAINTSSPMDTLVPGSVLHFTGVGGMTSNAPGANGKCGAAYNSLDDFISFTMAPRRDGSGSGDMRVPDGHPGATLDFHVDSYIEGPGAMGETLHANYAWVEGPATPASNTPAGEPRQLSNNWNSGGCGLTATTMLSLGRSTHLDHVQLWYNWSSSETSVPFAIYRNGQFLSQGTLQRGTTCAGPWCTAIGQVGSDLPAGNYQVRVNRAQVCQNAQSGGQGFIQAYGW